MKKCWFQQNLRGISIRVIYIFFGTSLGKVNCAKFHHCRIFSCLMFDYFSISCLKNGYNPVEVNINKVAALKKITKITKIWITLMVFHRDCFYRRSTLSMHPCDLFVAFFKVSEAVIGWCSAKKNYYWIDRGSYM